MISALSVRGLPCSQLLIRLLQLSPCVPPGMHSSRVSTEQLQECAYSEIQSGHTHCWVFVFLSYATDTLLKL